MRKMEKRQQDKERKTEGAKEGRWEEEISKKGQ
jgi:hypothetical protein